MTDPRVRFGQAEGEIRSSDFRNADLSGCTPGENVHFIDCDFSGVNFTKADLSGARFDGCKFQQAHFDNASLLQANFISACDLNGASLKAADCTSASFVDSSLVNVDATGGIFCRADFTRSDVKNATFDRADLSEVTNFKPDSTRMAGALAGGAGRDEWSRLKAEFTGLKFLMSLIPIIVFVTSILLKAYASLASGLYFAVEGQGGLSSLCGPDGSSCTQWPLWKIVLGLRESWFAFIFVMFSIAYNGLRFLVTLRVDTLVIQERSSGATPQHRGLKGYGWLHILRLILLPAKLLFLALFAWNMYELLATTVLLPNEAK